MVKKMRINNLNYILKIALVVIFISISINPTMPPGYSMPCESALRSPAYRVSDNAGIDEDLNDDGTAYDQIRHLLDTAERAYTEEGLEGMVQATPVLMRYLYSRDQDIQRRVQHILKKRDMMFVVRHTRGAGNADKTASEHSPEALGADKDRAPNMEIFEDMIKTGKIKPVVIINIKKTYEGVDYAYLKELYRLSE